MDEIRPVQYNYKVSSQSSTKKCVLTIDDGGTRGIVSLLVLKTLLQHVQELEYRLEGAKKLEIAHAKDPHTTEQRPEINTSDPTSIRKHLFEISTMDAEFASAPVLSIPSDLPRPHEYFDVIMGAGTGG